jgi:photosystem II stability/assembly factor-like uncharacterized protein
VSSDRGKTWKKISSECPREVVAIGSRVFALAFCEAKYTDDRGETWTACTFGAADRAEARRSAGKLRSSGGWKKLSITEQNLSCIYALGDDLLVGGQGVLLRSRAGGDFELSENPSTKTRAPMEFRAIHGPPEALVACALHHEIAASSDGGETWTIEKSARNSPLMYGVTSGENGAIVVAEKGAMYRRAPGSRKWTRARGPLDRARSMWTHADGTIYIGGEDAIARSTNGTTWKSTEVPKVSVEAIWGNADGLWAAAGDRLLHSTNGTAWKKRDPGVTSRLVAIAGFGDEIYAVGQDGTVVHSTNKGKSWSTVDLGTDDWLTAVWVGDGRAVIAGKGGALYELR